MLPNALKKAGIAHTCVSLYHTVVDEEKADELSRLIRNVDDITFASSSAVKAFMAMVENLDEVKGKYISIGPVTSKTAEDKGLHRQKRQSLTRRKGSGKPSCGGRERRRGKPMKTQLKRFLLTLGFMTRIPVNVDLGEVKDEDMHKGFLYYPVVGLVIGLVDLAVYLLVCLILPEVYGIIFALLANFFVTGAFHLEWSVRHSRWHLFCQNERADAGDHEDSRIGNDTGGIAMCFDILLKFVGLSCCDMKALMIFMMPVAGKMIQGAIVYKAIYPRETGIGIYVGTGQSGYSNRYHDFWRACHDRRFFLVGNSDVCRAFPAGVSFPGIHYRKNRGNHRRRNGSRK